MKTQTLSPIKRVKLGANRNRTAFDLVGIIISFSSSFKPSAKACKIPQNPVTLGPRLRCTEASNLRSAIVKKATAINEQTIVMIEFISVMFIILYLHFDNVVNNLSYCEV
jgi:hypothetical protein